MVILGTNLPVEELCLHPKKNSKNGQKKIDLSTGIALNSSRKRDLDQFQISYGLPIQHRLSALSQCTETSVMDQDSAGVETTICKQKCSSFELKFQAMEVARFFFFSPLNSKYQNSIKSLERVYSLATPSKSQYSTIYKPQV